MGISQHFFGVAGLVSVAIVCGCGGAAPTQTLATKPYATTTVVEPNVTSTAAGTTVALMGVTGSEQSAGSFPTGTITFYSGTTSLGSLSVVTVAPYLFADAQAQLEISTLPVGANTLTATYSGDSNYAASTSAPITVNVTPAGTTGGTSRSIYVEANDMGSSLLTFAPMSSGSVTPAALTAPSGVEFSSVAVDSAGNIYILCLTSATSATPDEILIYAAGATGTTAPVRTIAGAATTLGTQAGNIAVDSLGQIYVSTPTSVMVFATGANGNVAPVRTMSGAATGLVQAVYLAVDQNFNVYVLNINIVASSIFEFAPTANGNVAPEKTITGTATDLYEPKSLAVDSAGNIYTTALTSVANGEAEIIEFSANSSGNTTPERIITGSNTGYNAGGAICVDGAGNVYVTNLGAGLYPQVLIFGPAANGNVAPMTVVTSIAWSDTGLEYLAIH